MYKFIYYTIYSCCRALTQILRPSHTLGFYIHFNLIIHYLKNSACAKIHAKHNIVVILLLQATTFMNPCAKRLQKELSDVLKVGVHLCILLAAGAAPFLCLTKTPLAS